MKRNCIKAFVCLWPVFVIGVLILGRTMFVIIDRLPEYDKEIDWAPTRTMPSLIEDLPDSTSITVFTPGFKQKSIEEQPPCPIRCEHTHDSGKPADAIWLFMPGPGTPGRHAASGKPLVMYNMESDITYSHQRNEEFAAKFKYKMTYRLDADVPIPYPSRAEYGDFVGEIPEKDDDMAPVMYMQSNCVAYRDKFVRELSQYIDVDSYGRCEHNKDEKDVPSGGGRGVLKGQWNRKLDLLRRHKFYIAAENTITDYYFTERVFQSFAAGSVPIYLGAPNAKGNIEPAPKSVIFANDFSSPKELAEHLHVLLKDQAKYNEYLAWKKTGVSKKFDDLLKINDIHSNCRLCIKLAHKCGPSCPCGKYPMSVFPRLFPKWQNFWTPEPDTYPEPSELQIMIYIALFAVPMCLLLPSQLSFAQVVVPSYSHKLNPKKPQSSQWDSESVKQYSYYSPRFDK